MSRWSATARRTRAWLAQAALVLASVLVTLAAAEMLLRVWPLRTRLSVGGEPAGRAAPDPIWQQMVHRRSALPGLDYELRPSIDLVSRGLRVTTNRHGMRDREPVLAGRVARVAVLGDSLTFGWGVAAEQAYPQILEASLNQSAGGACQFDVLNSGVSGYSSRDESLVLRYKAISWRPRAVVVGYFLNDPEVDPRQPLRAHFRPGRWWQQWRLGALLELAWRRWTILHQGGGDYYRYLHADPRTWGSVLTAFEEMRRTIPPDVAAILAILPAVPAGPWRAYEYRPLHAQVGAAARNAGFTVLDLLPTFERHDPRQLRLSERDNHLSPAGHGVVAEALSLALAPRLTAACTAAPASLTPPPESPSSATPTHGAAAPPGAPPR